MLVPGQVTRREPRRHPESKSICDEDTKGRLERQPVIIDEGSIHYIGKETNRLKLDDSALTGVDKDSYAEYHDWKGIINIIESDDAFRAGISRRNLINLKRKARENGSIRPNKKTPIKLLKALDYPLTIGD